MGLKPITLRLKSDAVPTELTGWLTSRNLGKEKAHFLPASPVLTGFPPISMEMAKNETCNIGGINFCFTGTFCPTLYGQLVYQQGHPTAFSS